MIRHFIKSKWKLLIGLLGLCFIIGVWVALKFGSDLCAPRPRLVRATPSDLAVERVVFPSASGTALSGWFIPGQTNHGVVITMHGMGGTRRDLLDRARFLHKVGYSILLFDFQAHGESPGKNITFGYRESEDAKGAVDFIHKKLPNEKIAVIGTSLGGAAAILANPPLKVDAMILEMVYPTIDLATKDRIGHALGPVGRLFSPLLLWQLKPRLGIGPEDLRPIDHVANLTVPKFFIAGTLDYQTTIGEAKSIFQTAAEPKEFWAVEGGHHENLHERAPAVYEEKVLAFLKKWM